MQTFNLEELTTKLKSEISERQEKLEQMKHFQDILADYKIRKPEMPVVIRAKEENRLFQLTYEVRDYSLAKLAEITKSQNTDWNIAGYVWKISFIADVIKEGDKPYLVYCRTEEMQDDKYHIFREVGLARSTVHVFGVNPHEFPTCSAKDIKELCAYYQKKGVNESVLASARSKIEEVYAVKDEQILAELRRRVIENMETFCAAMDALDEKERASGKLPGQ